MNLALLNRSTQPLAAHPVFVNPDVLPKAWYLAFPAKVLRRGAVRTVQLLEHRVVVWRTSSGALAAVDAFCPHMGTDLGIGTVRGDALQCAFHHWRFDASGVCVGAPCAKEPPRARVRAWAAAEQYGFVWVYPDANPPHGVLEVPALAGREVTWTHGRPNREAAHPHVSMVNGLDAQHLQSVHGLDIEMQVELRHDAHHFHATLSGSTPAGTRVERLVRWFIGPRYCYAMTYQGASVASLTVMRGTYFRRAAWRWPELHMLFAYRLEADGSSTTWPIYVAERRPGLLGALGAWVRRLVTARAYGVLKDEDSRIYDHVRFRADGFIAMDGPVARYVEWVDALEPSAFSRGEVGARAARRAESATEGATPGGAR